jgi:predicted SAM-dependent methyltransferase
MSRVNLGSGQDYRDGWVNVDVDPSCDPDVLFDLEVTPWPFGDDEFEHALVDDVLEHISPPRRPDFISEVRRIVEPGGVFVNKLPTHTGWDVSHYAVPQWYWAEHPRHEGQWEIDEVRLRGNAVSAILPKAAVLVLLKYDAVWAARGVELRLR